MRVELVGRNLELSFPKHLEWVEELRAVAPQADWDRVREVWVVPATELTEVVSWARHHGFRISKDVERVVMPKRSANVRYELRAEGGLIYLRIPYDQVRHEMIKDIRGVIFDRAKLTYQIGLVALSPVIKVCDDLGVRVPDALRAVARMQDQQATMAVALSRQIDGVHVVVPGLQGELMPHQHVAVKYAAQFRKTFIADDMGVGKTLSALATLVYCHHEDSPSFPALITCPPKLGRNWVKEINRWFPHLTVKFLETKKDSPAGEDITIIGNAILSAKQAELRGYRSLVHDESHNYRTPTAARTRAAKAVAKAIPEDGIVLCLTGTPVTIRPREFVPQLEMLGMLDVFGGDMAFMRSHCDAKKVDSPRRDDWVMDKKTGLPLLDSKGKKVKRQLLDTSGATNLEELNWKLRGNGYVRRERMQVIRDLPPYFPRDTVVALAPAWEKEYRKAEADVVAYLVERATIIAVELGLDVRHEAVRARMKAEAGRHLVEISVLRKLSGLGKVEAMCESVETMVEDGRKVIIAAHHREVVDAYADHFGGLKIMGGMSNKAVEEHKRKFQETDAPVIVLSIQAAKEGHTLTAATDMELGELAYVSTEVDQLIGRAWRKGQTQELFVNYWLGDATIDIVMLDKLTSRRKSVAAMTSGSPVDVGPDVVDYLLDLGLPVAA